MPTHIRIALPTESDRKRQHRDEGSKELPGWAAPRLVKDEGYIANKNMALGRWLSRASENSGPKIAPGTKSS